MLHVGSWGLWTLGYIPETNEMNDWGPDRI